MIEGYCRYKMVQKCDDEDMALFIHKNGEWEKRLKHLNFFNYTDKFMVYDKGFASKMIKQPKNSPLRLACALFANKGDLIAQAYIDEKYNGNWCKAIEETGTFNTLFNGFMDYFNYRRNAFVEKCNELIKQNIDERNIKPRKTPIPASHGGVANLLKILTKTMHEQGSSIRTIARVQYTVCMNAGIYIPDEFITDVLVATEMNPNIFEEIPNEQKKDN